MSNIYQRQSVVWDQGSTARVNLGQCQQTKSLRILCILPYQGYKVDTEALRIHNTGELLPIPVCYMCMLYVLTFVFRVKVNYQAQNTPFQSTFAAYFPTSVTWPLHAFLEKTDMK